jgi:hypothetical protein
MSSLTWPLNALKYSLIAIMTKEKELKDLILRFGHEMREVGYAQGKVDPVKHPQKHWDALEADSNKKADDYIVAIVKCIDAYYDP